MTALKLASLSGNEGGENRKESREKRGRRGTKEVRHDSSCAGDWGRCRVLLSSKGCEEDGEWWRDELSESSTEGIPTLDVPKGLGYGFVGPHRYGTDAVDSLRVIGLVGLVGMTT